MRITRTMAGLAILLFAALGALDAHAQTYSVKTAFYGDARNQQDVSARVRQLANGRDFQVNPRTLGIDPAPGRRKTLTIVGISQNGTQTFTYNDGQTVSARMFSGPMLGAPVTPGRPVYPGGPGVGYPGGGNNNSLRIIQASYGVDRGRRTDVTGRLQGMVRNNRLNIVVNNETMGGDPALGQGKTLKVVYEYQRQRRDVTIGEYNRLSIP